MTTQTRNSMAAILSVIMTAVMWVTLVLGALVFILCCLGAYWFMSGTGSIELDRFGLGDFIFCILATPVLVFGITYSALQLRRILDSLADGDPFVPDNADRLRRLAIALGAIEIISLLMIIGSRAFFHNYFEAFELDIRIDIIPWAAVAALLVLSHVFREGTRLRDEEKMTI